MNVNQHDLSDDELDRLFSDAAEKSDFDFDPDSWKKMSQKLDAVNSTVSGESQAGNVWLMRGLFPLLALLGIVGAYYFFKPTTKSEQEKTLQTKQKSSSTKSIETNTKKDVATDKVDTDNFENKEISNESDAEISSKENTNTLEKENTNALKSDSYKKESIKDNAVSTNRNAESVAKNVESKENSLSKNTTSITKKENTSLSKKRNETTSLGKYSITKNIQATDISATQSVENVVSNDSPENNSLSKNNEAILALGSNKKTSKTSKSKIKSADNNYQINNTNGVVDNQTPIVQTTDVAPQTPQVVEVTQEKNTLGNLKSLMVKSGNFKTKFIFPTIVFESPKVKPIIPPSTSFNKGLYLRLGVSPDFSVVSFDETARLGSNWAALLEYRLSKRFSVQSGIIRSMKYYNAYPASYEWPSNWGTVPYSLVDINASCRMFDIPLNVRFDVSQKTKSRWFVGAGLTSYVMKNEKYIYNYENPNSSWIKWREWEGVSQKKPFYASTLNFSIGFEQQFFRRLSIQAEPFIKTPLKKIGFGQVNLSTIGVLVSAKYPIAKF